MAETRTAFHILNEIDPTGQRTVRISTSVLADLLDACPKHGFAQQVLRQAFRQLTSADVDDLPLR